jgi:hypothetical protein
MDFVTSTIEFNNIKPFSPFAIAFQITRKVMFEVYYNVRNDGSQYFSTMADYFNQPKTDFEECGQCQEKYLPHNSKVYAFFKKWDNMHLKPFTEEETYNELIKDLKTLMEHYNHVIREKHLNYDVCKDLSMMKLKKQNKKK